MNNLFVFQPDEIVDVDAAINGTDYNSDYKARNPDPYDTNSANPNSFQNPDLSYLDTNVSKVLNFYLPNSCFRILISIQNLNQYLEFQFEFQNCKSLRKKMKYMKKMKIQIVKIELEF